MLLSRRCTGSDAVTVYITVNGQREALDTYCGEKLPPMLMSNSHAMTVEFHSYRGSPTVTGFRANFEFVTSQYTWTPYFFVTVFVIYITLCYCLLYCVTCQYWGFIFLTFLKKILHFIIVYCIVFYCILL